MVTKRSHILKQFFLEGESPTLTYLAVIRILHLQLGILMSRWSDNTTTTETNWTIAKLDYLTLFYGVKEIITEPTHILENSSSCINLIFSNQHSLIMDSGVHPTLHSKIPPSNNLFKTQFRNWISSILHS